MKMITALAFVLLAGSALATELPVPGKKPSAVQPGETPAACMERLRAACVATHRTKLFTKACIFRNKYRCRS